ncbi:MAG: segregation/condensation protein A [Proteobacteria bacterium]|nr:segregation/condensation protein A [Pseudomonadota bacterium]
MSSEYFVKLDRFEGPLDLLLHLIRVHEIDIFAIDILKLATEYLNYLRLVRYSDLAEAGEFIAMGAQLIEIKSRSLLPTEERKSLNEDGIEEDPIKLLQERLLQYEMIRRAADWFSQTPQIGVEIQTGHEHERLSEVFKDLETPLEGDPARLIIMYEQILRDLAERKSHRIDATTHSITLEQTIERLAEYIQTVRYGMFQGLYNKFRSRYDMVVHFMAVLELSKQGVTRVLQQDMMGPLWVYRADLDESLLPLRTATMEVHDHSLDDSEIIAVESRAGNRGDATRAKYVIARPVSTSEGTLVAANEGNKNIDDPELEFLDLTEPTTSEIDS